MRNRLVYGPWTFEDVRLSEGNPYQEQTLFGQELGVDTLYLVTEHTAFYERYGWSFLTTVRDAGGQEERLYAAPRRED